ncbi:hypothetical protein ONZ51_g2536 [Trametes cubensis]|uniref:Uncharacterized protein n=1 Tax=Trametes cubensis TaxID=1111947 RepID=A0AAD7TZG9_9APHY|nr:hypothetical protein ONZ51_g2536 [Trametes cubensis]
MHRALHWSASLLLTVLASSVCLTHALPSILSPNASSVWTAASVQSVVWDIGEPDISPNAHGRVVLGYIDPIADEGGFYEYDDQPLSDDLLVSEGIIDVVVPTALPSGRYYYCVLIVGDARTRSEVFSIDNPVNPSTSTAKVVFPSTLSVGKAPPKNVSDAK